MEVAAFVILFVLGLIYLSWTELGGGLTVLIISGIIFALYKFLFSSNNKENKQYENSDYVKKALNFIEFYESLPQPKLLIITPEIIAARMSDDELGSKILTHQQIPETGDPWFHEQIKAHIGGEANLTRFRSLKLQLKVHNNDMDFPVIFMYAYCAASMLEQENYIKAIERKYRQKYGKELKIHHFADY